MLSEFERCWLVHLVKLSDCCRSYGAIWLIRSSVEILGNWKVGSLIGSSTEHNPWRELFAPWQCSLWKMFAWNSKLTLLSNSESTPDEPYGEEMGFYRALSLFKCPLIISSDPFPVWSISFSSAEKHRFLTDLNRIHTFGASEGIFVRFLVLF